MTTDLEACRNHNSPCRGLLFHSQQTTWHLKKKIEFKSGECFQILKPEYGEEHIFIQLQCEVPRVKFPGYHCVPNSNEHF